MLTGLKRFILWDYARGSLQYDLMVVLILAFIFVTPRILNEEVMSKGVDIETKQSSALRNISGMK